MQLSPRVFPSFLVIVACWSHILLQAGCTPEPPHEPLDARPQVAELPTDSAKSSTPVDARLSRLQKVTGNSGKLWTEVKDVRAILEAEAYERSHDLRSAQDAWFDALKTAQGKFGHRALGGWVKTYCHILGKRVDRFVLARLILAETQEGNISPYMRARGLTRDAAIATLLKSIAPECLEQEGAQEGQKAEDHPPAVEGLPANDPLLLKAARKSCSAGAASSDEWHQWLVSLDAPIQTYWRGLLAQQCGRPQDAIEAFKSAYPSLSEKRASQGLAVEAAGRLAGLQRTNGLRDDAAQTYSDLMKLWDKPGSTPEALDLEPLPFLLRRIDETLWACRYRAMVADYESGKIYGKKALDLIGTMNKLSLSRTAKEQLASLRAEAYHTLAFRISLERREFEGALSLTLLGLKSPDLPKEWQERLTWFAGLYDYLAGHYEGASRRWDELLATTKDDSLRSACLFWLAKVAVKRGRSPRAKQLFGQLTQEYALSYYSVVAANTLEVAGGTDAWKSLFEDPRNLAERLESRHDFSLERLRTSEKLRPLLLRAELLVAADLGNMTRWAVDEFEQGLTSEVAPESMPSAYVYLSRLQYATGSYLKAIGVTTKLTKAVPGFWRSWPEQMLIYFARPYYETFAQAAKESAIPEELAMAIARQESGFSPSVRSSANAIGVMQLIGPTAAKYTQDLELGSQSIEKILFDPGSNILIGSRYLHALDSTFKGYPAAVYGGYNAGEYAMDSWLKRRGHTDPQVFVELVPYSETKDYIKNVWRNFVVYKYLAAKEAPALVTPGLEFTPLSASPGPEPLEDHGGVVNDSE